METKRRHTSDLLFGLGLFCLFVITSLLLVLLGSRVYQNVNTQMDRNYDLRTSLVYITQKVRQCEGGELRLDAVAGQDALVLTSAEGAVLYETWIFCGNGQLREVTVQPGIAVNPTDGQQIMELDTLQLQLTAPGLLQVSITGAYGQQGATSVCFARGEAAV